MDITKRIFGGIEKVEDQDDGTIKVFGVASSGNRDDMGEIVMPTAMKAALPDYSKYPALREMHQPSAAGRTLELSVDDDGISHIIAHVVDPVAIKKVKTGTYSGFSIGGRVLKRDAKDNTIITSIKLSEVSLVDRPANPDAGITLWKADLGDEPMAYVPTNDEVKAKANELAKLAGSDKWKDYVAKARETLIAEHDAPQADPEPQNVEVREILPLVEEAVMKVAGGLDAADQAAIMATVHDAVEAGGDLDDEVAKAIAAHEAARQPIEEPAAEPETPEAEQPVEGDPTSVLRAAVEKADKKPYGNVKYADPKNGKYPIDTEAHIRAAWSYINMPKNQKGYTSAEVSAIKAKIVSAWKAKIDSAGPPSAEKMAAFGDFDKSAAALAQIAAHEPAPLFKGLYTVGRLAELMQSMAYIQQSVAYETAEEGDGSSMPADAAAVVASMGTLLIAMAQEEVSEVIEAYKQQGLDIAFEPAEDFAYAISLIDLCKADEPEMAKAGARHSGADAAHLQAAHDHLVKMGAQCAAPDEDDATGKGAPAEPIAAETEDLMVKAAGIITEQNEQIAKLQAAQDAVPDLVEKAIADALEKFRKEPLPPKTAASTHATPIGKGEDANPGTPTIQQQAEDTQLAMKAWEALSPEERAMALIKASQRRPIPVR